MAPATITISEAPSTNSESPEPYHDFSQVDEQQLDVVLQNLGISGKEGSDHCFPVRLHYMLSELVKDNMDNIISWQLHGRCFLIHKPKEFEKELLPTWFRQTKVSSFQRQCNFYGFKRIVTGPDRTGYYHPLFLRGKRYLAKYIQRTEIKGKSSCKLYQPDPDFYRMTYLPCDETPEKVEEDSPKAKSIERGTKTTNNTSPCSVARKVSSAPVVTTSNQCQNDASTANTQSFSRLLDVPLQPNVSTATSIQSLSRLLDDLNRQVSPSGIRTQSQHDDLMLRNLSYLLSISVEQSGVNSMFQVTQVTRPGIDLSAVTHSPLNNFQLRANNDIYQPVSSQNSTILQQQAVDLLEQLQQAEYLSALARLHGV